MDFFLFIIKGGNKMESLIFMDTQFEMLNDKIKGEILEVILKFTGIKEDNIGEIKKYTESTCSVYNSLLDMANYFTECVDPITDSDVENSNICFFLSDGSIVLVG